MYKNIIAMLITIPCIAVSILVLMELCIKTNKIKENKNENRLVSILVLMELCIKTFLLMPVLIIINIVSILVLMELCIKTSAYFRPKGKFHLFQSLF